MRILIAVSVSLVISIAMFVLMQKMTSTQSEHIKKETNPVQLTYLRDKKDTVIEKKKELNQKSLLKKLSPKS